nr:MAG TPA: hypothetical protein [Bacteriophage sp.]
MAGHSAQGVVRVSRKPKTASETEIVRLITATNESTPIGNFTQLVKDLEAAGIVINADEVAIKGNKVTIYNKDGAALFAQDGKLNANLIDAETIVANGIQGNTIDAKNATISNLNVKNVLLSGSLRSPFVQVIDSFEAPYTDNVVMVNAEWGGGTVHNLSWDVEQSGRRICIAGSMWNRQPNTIYGQSVLTIPEDAKNNGCRFYENGIAKTELYFSTEVLELIAYGNVAGTKDGKPEKYIYGWIVLNRIDLMTNHKYGRQKKVLAYGKVTGTNNGASIDYKTFDGSKMSISRGDKGLNILHIPKWADSASSIFVTLTNTSSYVSLKSIDTTSDGFNINVLARGTNSFDEGSFNFEISNFDDFG